MNDKIYVIHSYKKLTETTESYSLRETFLEDYFFVNSHFVKLPKT